MIAHAETEVMFGWYMIDSHDKTVAESTSFFFFPGCFLVDEKTSDAQVALYLWCYVLEAALCALLEKELLISKGYWREGSPNFPFISF